IDWLKLGKMVMDVL
uniref:Polybia-mastoparan-III n=1 Tax=Polybia paulista TaxID=291283 RepID=MAST3_POLPI|nr:RecName: Full=Polybia-mastoparan-III; Short=Polybia-MP-III; Short=Polybia-MPIII; AltName: Full=Mastoparan peptide; Short=MP; AltName: Full=Venom protein 13b; Short=VP13b [Polybia paulista]